MDIPLGKGDFDAGVPKASGDRLADLAHDGQPIRHIGDPDVELEVEAGFSEPREKRQGLGTLEDQRICQSDLLEDSQHQGNVGAVGRSDRDSEPGQGVGKGPVRHLLRNELGIGDNKLRAIEGLDDR